MPRVGFEPTIPSFERAKTIHALDRTATVIDHYVIHIHIFIKEIRFFIWLNPSNRSMALQSTQPLTEIRPWIFLGIKGGRRVRLTTSPPIAEKNVKASTSQNRVGLHGLLHGYLYTYQFIYKTSTIPQAHANLYLTAHWLYSYLNKVRKMPFGPFLW
jgi:hypothetical protein